MMTDLKVSWITVRLSSISQGCCPVLRPSWRSNMPLNVTLFWARLRTWNSNWKLEAMKCGAWMCRLIVSRASTKNSRWDFANAVWTTWLTSFSSQRAFAVTSAGIEGGKNLAESAQDLERTRKAINLQLAEFDGVKKSLMRDLQNRCEKVCPIAFTWRSTHSTYCFKRLLSWRFN